MGLGYSNRLIRELAHQRTDATIDIALRLRVKETGEASQVYGGRWHKWQRRYLAPDELIAPLDVFEIEVGQVQFDAITNFDDQLMMIIGGRRFGKSRCLGIKGVVNLARMPGRTGQFIAPTFDKTKILWAYTLKSIPRHWIAQINTTDRYVVLHNGAGVFFSSANRPDSLTGHGGAMGSIVARQAAQYWDESQNISQEALDIGTPSMGDAGDDFQIMHGGTLRRGMFATRVAKFKADAGAKIYSGSSYENPFIFSGAGSAFELAAKTMDQSRFRREILAELDGDGGLVYHLFSRETHVRQWDATIYQDCTAKYCTDRFGHPARFVVGVDYGVGQQHATVFKLFETGKAPGMFVVDEIHMKMNADADDLGMALIERGYGGAIVCDDAQGKHSKHGPAPSSRMKIRGFRVFHKRMNPRIMSRVDSVLGLLKSFDGQVRLQVDPKCTETIAAFENQELINDKPDKDGGYDHCLDSLGYAVHYFFKASAVDFENMERAA